MCRLLEKKNEIRELGANNFIKYLSQDIFK